MSGVGVSNVPSPGYSNTSSATVSPTAGSLLVAYVRAATSNSITLSDSKGQTWTKHVDHYDSSAGVRTVIASAKNVASGSTTVTSTTTGVPYHQCGVIEYTGCDTATQPDGVPATATISSATSWNSNAFTATTSDPVLFGASAGSGSSNPAAGASWTAFGTVSIWNRELGEYRLPGASGSYSATFTAATGFTGSAYLVVFKGSSGGGGLAAHPFFGGGATANPLWGYIG